MLHQFRQVMSLRLANALQAMMFASFYTNSGYVLFYFGLGYVLGILRLQSRVLWPGIVLHFAWNGCWLMKVHGYM
ncbi:MAG: membrane protease YdiL (CAAX protease family) [Planctomycetota bacterium]|jgi:membrane protease YdiL (CAAX protease family)